MQTDNSDSTGRQSVKMGLMEIIEPTESLYYECHITVEPIDGDRLGLFRILCEIDDFRVADLLMKKPDGPWGPSEIDSFSTGRDKSFQNMHRRMLSCVSLLRDVGITVWRYKIEKTLLDVRLPKDRPSE